MTRINALLIALLIGVAASARHLRGDADDPPRRRRPEAERRR